MEKAGVGGGGRSLSKCMVSGFVCGPVRVFSEKAVSSRQYRLSKAVH